MPIGACYHTFTIMDELQQGRQFLDLMCITKLLMCESVRKGCVKLKKNYKGKAKSSVLENVSELYQRLTINNYCVIWVMYTGSWVS